LLKVVFEKSLEPGLNGFNRFSGCIFIS